MTAKIGIRREDKNKWERRVPLIPSDVADLVKDSGIQFVVQPSPIRVFPQDEYEEAGARVDEDISGCDIVFAVKEIPMDMFREGQTYVFFSHTVKGQSYNMDMLRKLKEMKCNLIDYERIVNEKNQRLIFFGKHAGLAGMIDTFCALGARLDWEELSPNPFKAVNMSYTYDSLGEAMEKIRERAGDQVKKNGLPVEMCPFIVGVAGYGNVASGVQEILDLFPVETLEPEELEPFIEKGGFDRRKIYKTVFKEEHLVMPKEEGAAFELNDYYTNPDKYRSAFNRYLPYLNMLMNCIYWDTPYPRIFTKEDARKLYLTPKPPRIKIVGDITCDIDGSIEFTAKPTEPDNPVFVYDPEEDVIIDGVRGNGPVVMAVDNLPCELPREASGEFSRALKPFVHQMAKADFNSSFDQLELPDPIKKALILHLGEFTPEYTFMEKFLS